MRERRAEEDGFLSQVVFNFVKSVGGSFSIMDTGDIIIMSGGSLLHSGYSGTDSLWQRGYFTCGFYLFYFMADFTVYCGFSTCVRLFMCYVTCFYDYHSPYLLAEWSGVSPDHLTLPGNNLGVAGVLTVLCRVHLFFTTLPIPPLRNSG